MTVNLIQLQPMLTAEYFRQQAKIFDPSLFVRVTNYGSGGEEHWRIVGGQCNVSFWPFSAKQTVFVETTGKRYFRLNIDQILELTKSKPSTSHKASKGTKYVSSSQSHSKLVCPDCGKRLNKHGSWYDCVATIQRFCSKLCSIRRLLSFGVQFSNKNKQANKTSSSYGEQRTNKI